MEQLTVRIPRNAPDLLNQIDLDVNDLDKEATITISQGKTHMKITILCSTQTTASQIQKALMHLDLVVQRADK